jgi:hypothetical protein
LQNGEVVIDNDSSSARAFGFWGVGTNGSGYTGSNYLQDGNSAKGTKEVRYTPSLEATGDYYVYARWTRRSDNATNVPFDVFYGPDRALRRTTLIDQRNRGGDGGWILIGGPYRLEKDSGAFVRIRNSFTDGYVIADAVRFLAAAPLPASPKALTRAAPTPTPAPVNPFADVDDDRDDPVLSGIL